MFASEYFDCYNPITAFRSRPLFSGWRPAARCEPTLQRSAVLGKLAFQLKKEPRWLPVYTIVVSDYNWGSPH